MMLFKDCSTFGSSVNFVQEKILAENIMGNSCVKSFRIFTSGSRADVN